MNETSKARWQLLGGVFFVIILVHLIAIAMIVSSQSKSVSAPTVPAPVAPVLEPPRPQPQPEKAEKPGFWKRLFGKKQETKTPEEPVVASTPSVTYRYKVPSTNPLFGKPFDHSSAVRELPEKTVPGEKNAKTGIVVDLDSRKVLWEKKADAQVPVASMVKMMTLLLAFEAMEANPEIRLDTPVQISREVLRVPRTGVIYLDPRETLPLSDLLKAVTIKSANDAAVQVAILFGGTHEKFIQMMNTRALELGMIGTRFVSACGLPDSDKQESVSTARDMVILGERLLEYPKILEWSQIQLDYIRKDSKPFMLNTTNNLINPHYPGVDGLKTGFTNGAGFCLTFSALRNNRRIVGCVTGFPQAKQPGGRDPFARKLIDWAYTR